MPLYWRGAGLQPDRHLEQPRFTNGIILTLRIDDEPVANCLFAMANNALSIIRPGYDEWVLASRESTLHDVMVQRE